MQRIIWSARICRPMKLLGDRLEPFPRADELSEAVAARVRQETASAADAFREGRVLIYRRDSRLDEETFWYTDGLSSVSMAGATPSLLWADQADIKRVWKKSLMHFLIPPALHAAATKDRAMACRVADVMCDWAREHGDQRGAAWAVALTTALRMSVWAYVAYFLGGMWTDEQRRHIGCTIHKMMQFVLHNVEGEGIANNHYAGNIAGLAVCTMIWPGLDPHHALRPLLVRELERIARRQFYSDGVHFEQSLHYHRLVVEMLMAPIAISETLLPGKVFSDRYKARIGKAIEVLQSAVNRNGYLPQIGDNDSEIVLHAAYELGPPRNITSFLAMCRHFLQAQGVRESQSDRMALLAGYGLRADILEQEQARILSKQDQVYSGPGWIFMRKGPFDVGMVCGGLGTAGLGTHDHNHCNEVFFSVGGRELVVDPGHACYTRDVQLRNRLRSVQSHSTIECGVEPGQWREGGRDIFRIRKPWKASLQRLAEDRYQLNCSYAGLQHRRTVIFADDHIMIEDVLTDRRVMKQQWILHPNVKVISLDGQSAVYEHGEHRVLFRGNSAWSVQDRIYSDSFGNTEPTHALVQEGVDRLICRISLAGQSGGENGAGLSV